MLSLPLSAICHGPSAAPVRARPVPGSPDPALGIACTPARNPAAAVTRGDARPPRHNNVCAPQPKRTWPEAERRSLSSKVVSQYSSLLSPMAVDAVLKVMDPSRPNM